MRKLIRPMRLVIHLPYRVLRVPLEKEATILGSKEGCNAVVHHPTVSRRHARLRDFRRQMSTASCLLLIMAAIVYWQIREIERIPGEIGPDDDVPVGFLNRISPISWENVEL